MSNRGDAAVGGRLTKPVGVISFVAQRLLALGRADSIGAPQIESTEPLIRKKLNGS